MADPDDSRLVTDGVADAAPVAPAEPSRPLSRWERPIESRSDRFAAWTNMVLNDHGIFRLIYPNRFQVDDKLWRSSQPAPTDIRWLAERGVRTIVNLRGGRAFGAWPLEVDACERAGIRLVNLPMFSREAPSRETIRAAKEMFDSIAYPALVHCKSGADRAGLAATLYLILHRNVPVAEAMKQLSPRFGHIRSSRTGVLDAVFRTYLERGAPKGLGFVEWIESDDYDPVALRDHFRSTLWSDVLVDRILGRE